MLARLAGEDDTPAELAGSWRALASTHGRLSIGALAREVGYSRQHLARRFRDEFGLGPKLAGRILRFQRANRLLRAAPSSVSLAEMAAACGYTDEDYGSRGFSVRDPEGNLWSVGTYAGEGGA